MFDATRLHHLRWRKKKVKPTIIPAANFASKTAPASKENQPEKSSDRVENHPEKTVSEVNEPVPAEKPAPEKKEAPNIQVENKTKTSGLSLKSIQRKKELLAKQKEKEQASEAPKEKPYTETQVLAAWNDYSKRLKKHGNKILASILDTDSPSVNAHKIHLELPNETMKVELQRAQGPLLNYIRKKIENDRIELEIQVNEKAEKKYAFTPREKYEKLKEKNPLLEKLRKTFDLDVN